MPFEYKKVLLLGATSGIGHALAVKFLENGVSVIAVGRRQERLDVFKKEYGNHGKATLDTAAFDLTNLKEIPNFAKEMFTLHPDIDCVFLNSGLQRSVNFADIESVDLDKVDLRDHDELDLILARDQGLLALPPESRSKANIPHLHDIWLSSRADSGMSCLLCHQGRSAPHHPCDAPATQGCKLECQGHRAVPARGPDRAPRL